MSPDFLSSILLDGLMAAIAATGFAVISNPPKRAIAVSALLAAIGKTHRRGRACPARSRKAGAHLRES